MKDKSAEKIYQSGQMPIIAIHQLRQELCIKVKLFNNQCHFCLQLFTESYMYMHWKCKFLFHTARDIMNLLVINAP